MPDVTGEHWFGNDHDWWLVASDGMSVDLYTVYRRGGEYVVTYDRSGLDAPPLAVLPTLEAAKVALLVIRAAHP